MDVLRIIKQPIRRFLIDHFPHLIIEHEWPGFAGRKIDWNNPVDLNEKIQWLSCFSDTSEWSRLTDKYLVREYVKSKGLGDLLPELYGVWEKAEDIDFDTLPCRFVLKCNHDSGSVFIIDKRKINDFDALRRTLCISLNRKFGYNNCEPHYNRISPMIIAEEFLESHDPEVSFSSSLIDYKVWCFHGRPYSIWVCYGRTSSETYVNIYDLDWNVHPEVSVFTKHYRNGRGIVPKPTCLDRMLASAAVLADDFPEVRVDFFEVDDNLYFGEMTFTALAGRMEVFTDDYLKTMGSQIVLPARGH